MKTNYPNHVILCLVLVTLACVPTASAFYNPTAGRWLNRDPLEEGSGPHLECFLNNSPISSWDIDGRWTTGPDPSPQYQPNPRLGQCGGFYVRFLHVLQGLANCVGYMVQKITITGDIYDCAGKRKGLDIPPFWERSSLAADFPNHQDVTNRVFPDDVQNPSRLRTLGSVTFESEVRFYCESQTGDLSGWNQSIQSEGRTIVTGPITTTPPAFWQLPISAEGIVRWRVYAEWDCCFCSTIGPRPHDWRHHSTVIFGWSPGGPNPP